MKIYSFVDLCRGIILSQEEEKRMEEMEELRESLVKKILEEENKEKLSSLGLNEVAKIWNNAKDVEIRNISREGYSAIEISFTIHGERNKYDIEIVNQAVDFVKPKLSNDFRFKVFKGDFNLILSKEGKLVLNEDRQTNCYFVKDGHIWESFSQAEFDKYKDQPKIFIKTNYLKFTAEDTIVHNIEDLGNFIVTAKDGKFRYKGLNNLTFEN